MVNWLWGWVVTAPITLVPGLLLLRAGIKSRRWAAKLGPARQPGETGVVVGRVISETSTKGPLSGRAAALALCDIVVSDVGSPTLASDEGWFQGQKPLVIDVDGKLVAVEWTEDALHALAEGWGIITRRDRLRFEDLPEELRKLKRLYPPSCTFRVTEHTLAPGDRACAIGTLEVSGEGHSPIEAAPLRLVGTRKQPLLFSTPGLTDFPTGAWTAQEMLGWCMIALWVFLAIGSIFIAPK